ncbi:MAG: FecR domain-containing protein, partial [Phycisphaerales bacterium]
MNTMPRSIVATALLASLAGTALARQDAAKPVDPPATTPAEAAPAQPVVTPSTDGASRPADATPTPIVVKAVQGSVALSMEKKGSRKRVKAGDVIPEGAYIFTGRDGRVQIQVGIGQVFTIDSLSEVRLSEAIATQGKEKTTVDMPYGRVKFDVTSTAIANDVQIASPDTTLAVKGTSGGMEVVQGFPTFAFGGETNSGRFTITFPQRVVATIVGSEGANSDSPDPAALAAQGSYVEVGDGLSRFGDEIEFVFDFNTVFQRVFGVGDTQGIGIAPALTGTFVYDEESGNIILFDPFPDDPEAEPLIAGTPTNFNPEAAFVGSALRRTPAGTQFLRLESDGSSSSRLLGFILGFGERPATQLATFSTVLNGLATLGDSIYSVEYPVGEVSAPTGIGTFHVERLVSLNPAMGTVHGSMQFGTPLEGGLGAFTSRGTLLVAGRLPEFTNLSNGNAGYLGANAMILEVDPRINFLSRALSDVTDDFAVVDFDTILPDDLNPLFKASITNQTVTGMSQSRATFGGGVGVGSNNFVLQINLRANVDGTPRDISLILNGDSARVPGDVPLRLVGPSPQSVRDFATETATPAGSVLLGAAPAHVDGFIPTLFGQMAYSELALASGVVERLARNAILSTAVSPFDCMVSLDLNNLAGFLANHTMQRSGMGASIFDLRAGLPNGHPCLAPGQPGIGLTGETFFVYDFQSQSIIERDLNNNSVTRFSGVTSEGDLADTTVSIDPQTGHSLLLALEIAVVPDGGYGGSTTLTRLLAFDLTIGGSGFNTHTEFSGGSNAEIVFRGLTSFGASLYASGFASEDGSFQAGIFGLNLSNSSFALAVDPGIVLIGCLFAAPRPRPQLTILGSVRYKDTQLGHPKRIVLVPR